MCARRLAVRAALAQSTGARTHATSSARRSPSDLLRFQMLTHEYGSSCDKRMITSEHASGRAARLNKQ